MLSVSFDKRGMAEINISSDGGDGRHDKESPDESQGVVAATASALGNALGAGPVSPDEEEQTWTVGDVQLTLDLEWKRFTFTLKKLRV